LEYFGKRKPADFGKEAARIAVMNLSAKEIEAGAQTVVLGNAESGVLLHEGVGHALEADYNYKKLSNFSRRVGEKVASDICIVVDEGSIRNLRGSINIDDEGVHPAETVLIENGVLRSYLTDRVSAKQLGMKLTGNGRCGSYNFPP
jgi:TldD protein